MNDVFDMLMTAKHVAKALADKMTRPYYVVNSGGKYQVVDADEFTPGCGDLVYVAYPQSCLILS